MADKGFKKGDRRVPVAKRGILSIFVWGQARGAAFEQSGRLKKLGFKFVVILHTRGNTYWAIWMKVLFQMIYHEYSYPVCRGLPIRR